MKEFYIVKNGKQKNLLRPVPQISVEEFYNSIDLNPKFTWHEDTELGIKRERYNPVKKRVSAYLNFNINDEKHFTYVTIPIFGYIKATFDYNVKKENLLDLIEYAKSLDCQLWQYKPKQMIIDREFAENYGKKKKKED